jgi:hypothetical protein
MSKDKIADYDGATAGNNTDIGGISIAEGMLPSAVNNSMRELTRQLGAFADGTEGIDVLNLHDDDASASIKIQAPATVTTTTTFTLPDGDGTSGYALVTNGSGQLSWASAGGIANVADDTTPQLGGDLDTNGNDINFGDNDKAVFGAGSDLQIFHDGSASFIKDVGTGPLYIDGGTSGSINLRNSSGEDMAAFVGNGAVFLYHNNAAKFATTATGADINGVLTADGLSQSNTDGAAGLILNRNFSGDVVGYTNTPDINFTMTDTATSNQVVASITPQAIAGTGDAFGGRFRINTANSSGTEVLRLSVDESGDISFYDSTGTTQGFFWDASTQRLGLGTTAPTEDLHIKGKDGAHADVIIQAYTGYNSGLNFNDNAGMAGRIVYNHSSNFMEFDTNGTEAARIDSNGNLLINHTATGDWTNTSGAQIRATGLGIFTQSASSAVIANRLSSDGTILDLRKDGTSVGSIGNSGANLYIEGNPSGKSGLEFEGTAIVPRDSGAVSDGVNNLGSSANRFKDAYFGGTVYADQFLGQNDTNTGIAVGGGDVLQLSTGGSEKARVDASGNFLLGKSTASGANTEGVELRPTLSTFTSDGGTAIYASRLTNDGNVIAFERSSSSVGSISVTTSGTTYNTTSDLRLKENIEPLVATDKLMAMNPVSYNWKAEPDGPRSMGFIAQEMQQVMPEAVAVGDDEDAMMSMDYGRITPVLVAALQDAHRKIEELESRIAAMEAK